ncbi:MAG: hypothetical protein FVQ83_15875 [Chloroflexi bacterium]|nr:hypothetical protein [Chloroflexota bacterium]
MRNRMLLIIGCVGIGLIVACMLILSGWLVRQGMSGEGPLAMLATETKTPRPTRTPEPTYTQTSTPTATNTATNTAIPSNTPTITPTPTQIGGGGGQIAFSSIRDGNFEIYMMNANGSDVRRLTDDLANDFSSTWSLDGEQIAFTSDRDGNLEIYVMNASGGDVSRLTNNSADDMSPGWSSDGQ